MKEIQQIDDLNTILQKNKDTYLIFFKHSTRCPISWNAKKEVDSFLEHHPEYSDNTYLINVIDSKPLSNHIAEITQVKHESPQIIIMKSDTAIKHFSHLSITEKNILDALK